MIRYYCDGCGKELDPLEAGKRLIGKMERITVEVMWAVDGVYNGGLVCHDCIRKIVASTTRAQPPEVQKKFHRPTDLSSSAG